MFDQKLVHTIQQDYEKRAQNHRLAKENQPPAKRTGAAGLIATITIFMAMVTTLLFII